MTNEVRRNFTFLDNKPMIDAIVRVLDARHIQCGDIGWDGRHDLAAQIAEEMGKVLDSAKVCANCDADLTLPLSVDGVIDGAADAVYEYECRKCRHRWPRPTWGPAPRFPTHYSYSGLPAT